MKLITTVINKEDSKGLIEKLSSAGFSVTKLESQSGFLENQSNVLLIGIEDEKTEEVVNYIKDCCKSCCENVAPIPKTMEPGELIIPETEKITTSGAIIFVLDVEKMYKL